jgi:dTDP-glucose 4,6-dehydratase
MNPDASQHSPERLLVTGGAGFIGANFVHYWLNAHPDSRVVVLDALTYAGNRDNLAALENLPSFRFVHGDIRDQNLVEGLLDEEGIDTIVHFAAESHVDRSILGPDPFLDTNVTGTHALLKAARMKWVEAPGKGRGRFHHVSTDEVYGSLEPDDPPFTEDSPYRPNSPYAASKAASDHLVRAYHRTYGLDVTISNCSNNYGPYQYPEKLLPLMIVNLLEGRELPVYGDGGQVRDWLHVSDHCRAVELVIRNGESGATWNVGGDCECANIDLVGLLCDLVDSLLAGDAELRRRFPAAAGAEASSRGLIRFVADRPGHDRRYAIDSRTIRERLGFRPAFPLEEGVRRTVKWYLEHESWWRRLIDDRYREWLARQYGASR